MWPKWCATRTCVCMTHALPLSESGARTSSCSLIIKTVPWTKLPARPCAKRCWPRWPPVELEPIPHGNPQDRHCDQDCRCEGGREKSTRGENGCCAQRRSENPGRRQAGRDRHSGQARTAQGLRQDGG